MSESENQPSVPPVEEPLAERYNLEEAERRTRKRNGRLARIAGAVVLVAICAFCGWQVYDAVRPVEISEYAQQYVGFAGLSDEELFMVTVEELSELPCEKVSVTGEGRSTGQGAPEKKAVGYGPTLEDAVASLGCDLSDYDRVVVVCNDGYQISIALDELEQPVYLAIGRGKDPLPEPMRPLRLIVPDLPAAMWCYGVEYMIFERADSDTVVVPPAMDLLDRTGPPEE